METSSEVQDKSTYRLCRNTDCERYPDDEDFDKDNEAEYQPRGEWRIKYNTSITYQIYILPHFLYTYFQCFVLPG